MPYVISILLNGKELFIESGKNLEDLIIQSNLEKEKIAVEINENVISRSSYKAVLLENGMKIEIITFVGGG